MKGFVFEYLHLSRANMGCLQYCNTPRFWLHTNVYDNLQVGRWSVMIRSNSRLSMTSTPCCTLTQKCAFSRTYAAMHAHRLQCWLPCSCMHFQLADCDFSPMFGQVLDTLWTCSWVCTHVLSATPFYNLTWDLLPEIFGWHRCLMVVSILLLHVKNMIAYIVYRHCMCWQIDEV